jgi:hypothetical protein
VEPGIVGGRAVRRKRPEQQLQIAVATFLRHALRPPVLWSAFPAGGGGAIRGSILKAMGLQAGWPDVLVIAPGPIIVGIELKVGKGRQSPQQISIENGFLQCNAMYYVARSVDEVEGFLRGVGVPLHARIVEGGRGILKALPVAA